jgi:phosphatidylserine/phosphatidylglycerophosphate/cardiolipin synthase-like enzyme
MPDSVIRKETTHIDEVTRTASASTQWLLEKRNIKGAATHPITHNNQLRIFICGEEGFADIAREIANARESIDLICWGFDPGMELVRSGTTWPRGETYGDVLIAAGKRGVKVRLLVWYDPLGSASTSNLVGYARGDWSHNNRPPEKPEDLSARNSLALTTAAWMRRYPDISDAQNKRFAQTMAPQMPLMARAQYCNNWFTAAFDGELQNIEVRRRSGSSSDIKRSLRSEAYQPAGLSDIELEKVGMTQLGTHHQKPVLIDYAADNGSKAVGYVMGLNSVTDYWDTAGHDLENERREQGAKLTADESVQRPRCAHVASCDQSVKCKFLEDCIHVKDAARAEAAASGKPGFRTGFESLKPYQDYACRIAAGQALACLYKNFMDAWDRAPREGEVRPQHKDTAKSGTIRSSIPPALLRKAGPGDSSVQIVRTQPQDNDKTIKELYMLAASKAALACGYLYVENQYFQCEEWARHLLQTRKQVIAAWKAGSAKAGKTLRDMPVMHVFIVIPVPERGAMVPRTYDALAVLGQQTTMTGQHAMIEKANRHPIQMTNEDWGIATEMTPSNVVEHANTISKPDIAMLEEAFGIKVSVAMLQTCGIDQERWRYREIYIHSKLLLVRRQLPDPRQRQPESAQHGGRQRDQYRD